MPLQPQRLYAFFDKRGFDYRSDKVTYDKDVVIGTAHQRPLYEFTAAYGKDGHLVTLGGYLHEVGGEIFIDGSVAVSRSVAKKLGIPSSSPHYGNLPDDTLDVLELCADTVDQLRLEDIES